MKWFRVFVLVCVLATPVFGQDPAPTPTIVLPDLPVPPIPPPSTLTPLPADYFYVVRCSVPLVIVASPQDLVSIAPQAGPMTVRGRFVGGNGSIETKIYQEKYLYFVDAVGSGKCELIIMPVGVNDPKQMVRRMLDVGGNTPTPPNPNPTPEPTDAWYAPVKAAYLSETGPKTKIGALAAVFRQAATDVKTSPLTTAKAYLDNLHTVATTLVGTDLPNTRKAVSSLLGTVLPVGASAPLDDATKTLCSTTFQRISVLLDALASLKGVK